MSDKFDAPEEPIYNSNEGMTISLWHPNNAVTLMNYNRKMVEKLLNCSALLFLTMPIMLSLAFLFLGVGDRP